MSKAQLVITAVVLEGRSKTKVARDYDLSHQWVHQLVTRYKADGSAAFQPRSRRPHSNPRASSTELEERIVRLRKTLDKAGYDAGAATIAEHLARDPRRHESLCAIHDLAHPNPPRVVVPRPYKRPRSAWKRFTAAQPNPALASRRHPLAARRRHRGRNPQRPRRPLAGGAGQPGPTQHDRPRRRGHLPRRVRPLGHPRRSLDRHSIWVSGVGPVLSAGGKDRCRPAPARHRCLTDWSAQRLLAC